MKFGTLFLAAALTVGVASANDTMKKSMSLMSQGMSNIQAGFMNNNIELINSGVKLVSDGNKLFSTVDAIKPYLPDNKKHLVNTAKIHSDVIKQQINVLTGRLDEKSFTKAGQAYSDMLNACSSCHAIVRNW